MVNAKNLGWQNYMYSGPMGHRPYFVYTPPDYKLERAVPLIVMLHGCRQTAADFADGTQMNRLADQYNFIVVYPQQTNIYNQNTCWNWFDPVNQSRGSGEPAIIAGIVQAIKQNAAQWTIDTRRIYVAGISAGAAMAVNLGVTYPDIFAAIGIHSGVEYQAATNPIGALKTMRQGGPDPVEQGQVAYTAMGAFARIVPIIVFHGTRDYIVNSINGDQVVQQWIQTDILASNGAYQADFKHPTHTTTDQVPGGRSYTRYRWHNHHGRGVQEYWKVNGMGHGWSGGSPSGTYTDLEGPGASEAMYRFFIHHPMSRVPFWEKLRRTLANWFKAEAHG